MSIIWRLVAPLATPLLMLVVASVSISGMSLYNRFIGHPNIAREARLDYVHISERVALEAQLTEVKRQNDIYRVAHQENAELAADLTNRWLVTKAQAENDRNDYEAKLDALGRRCNLDDADIKWLQRNPEPTE